MTKQKVISDVAGNRSKDKLEVTMENKLDEKSGKALGMFNDRYSNRYWIDICRKGCDRINNKCQQQISTIYLIFMRAVISLLIAMILMA